jgi:hypothetical protein
MRSLTRSGDEIRNNHWRFGYCTWLSDPDLVRMGNWNGDTMGGSIVSASEIETREYNR